MSAESDKRRNKKLKETWVLHQRPSVASDFSDSSVSALCGSPRNINGRPGPPRPPPNTRSKSAASNSAASRTGGSTSDTAPSQPEDSPPGAASAAMEEEARRHVLTTSRATLLIGDYFQNDAFSSLDLSTKKAAIQDAHQEIRELRAAAAFFTTAVNLDRRQDLLTACLEAKTTLLDAIKQGGTEIDAAESAVPTNSRPPSANSGRSNESTKSIQEEIKADLVRSSSNALLEEAEELVNEANRLLETECNTNLAIRKFELEWIDLEKRMRRCSHNLDKLTNAAVDAGEREEAVKLDDADKKIDAVIKRVERVLRADKRNLGIPPGQSMSNIVKNVNVKAPVFTGKQDDMDYYTFIKAFNDYTETVGMHTAAEKLLKLKSECLKGVAADHVHTIDVYEELIRELDCMFGRPQILFSNRSKEIEKLGTCPSDTSKRRNWLVGINAKLTSVKSIAEEHDLEFELVTSGLANVVQDNLAKEDRDSFKKRMMKKARLENRKGISRKDLMEELMCFISDLAQDSNYALDFELANKRNLETQEKKPQARSRTFNLDTLHSNESFDQDSGEEEWMAPPQPQYSASGNLTKEPQFLLCKLCGKRHTTLAFCTKFQKSLAKNRFSLCSKTGSCYLCLRLDSGFSANPERRSAWFEKHKEVCNFSWACNVDECSDRPDVRKNHFLLCARHLKQNECRHDEFVKSMGDAYNKVRFFYASVIPSEEDDLPTHEDDDIREKNSSIAASTRNNVNKTQLSKVYHVMHREVNIENDVSCRPIYMVQNVKVGDKTMLIFFDSGCLGAAISDRAYSCLDTVTVRVGPTVVEVAGGSVITLPHGDERLQLPLAQGGAGQVNEVANITALRMPEVTSAFPCWQLQKAWDDLNICYKSENPGAKPLPTVEQKIGGQEVDIMLGIRYSRHFPKFIFSLPSGLSIYEAKIHTGSKHRGVLGGPHSSWRSAAAQSHILGARAYFTNELRAYVSQDQVLRSTLMFDGPVAQDVFEHDALDEGDSELSEECLHVHCQEHCGGEWTIPSQWKVDFVYQHISQQFKDHTSLDSIGSEVTYRCVRCRNCTNCRQSEIIERTSLAEEREQALIEQCVKLHPDEKKIFSKLPFIVNPSDRLNPNLHIAQRILEGQVRLVNKTPEVREDVLKSHKKLVDNGHVVKVKDLAPEVQDNVMNGGYYIPWRFVHNAHSLSTPVRIVFDASSCTPQGASLNEILARGQNKLASLLHLLMKFRGGKSAFSCDISMAYNGVKIYPEQYKYQKYLWIQDLKEGGDVEVMVVVTLIYGVRPAGNLCMAAFQKLAEYASEHYPDLIAGADVLRDNSYVDDIMASFLSDKDRDNAVDQLLETLHLGSLCVKGITLSGHPPPEKVSKDGISVGLLGYLWAPESDSLMLDIKPLFLGKSKRGRLPALITGDIREALRGNLTKRVLTGKVMGVWDPLGLVTPFTAQLKLDLNAVTRLAVDWDDPLPPEFVDAWAENLEKIQKLGDLSFSRAVIHPDAATTDLDLLICVDASQAIAVAAVYVRSRLRNGKFHVQLLTAKSKLVNMQTVPRGELRAAVIGATLGRIAHSNLFDFVGEVTYFTDSAIALFWINQDQRPLQVGVRNCVIEIRRLTNLSQWFHIKSEHNPADIGTRAVAIELMGRDSEWYCGKNWMKMEKEDMPVKTIKELCLTRDETVEAHKEIRNSDVQGIVLNNLVSRVSERYAVSQFIWDPCSKPWPRYLHLIAVVVRCCQIWRKERPCFNADAKGRPVVNLSEEDVKLGERYVFIQTTKEVKHFNKKEKFAHLGEERDGILVYTGRVLAEQTIKSVTGNFIDLSPVSFVKPIIDRYSPVAYAVMTYAHVTLTHHGSVAATVRESRSIAYILGGRDLSKEIRRSCPFCARYKARMVAVELGKLHQNRLTIAPAFYFCQIDLMGPFLARCEHNHRSTVKVWGVIFKCPSSLAVSAHCVQAYNTDAFLQAYSRFTSRHGHPAKIYTDAGSQLLKALKEMSISAVDITKAINVKYGTTVEFETCPAGSHEAQGVVERAIREVRRIFDCVFAGLKLDILSFETAFCWIASELNSLPICLGNRTDELGDTDLITPARLILGRNNQRAPVGPTMIGKPGRLMQQIAEVEKAWWKAWQTEKLIDLIPTPRAGDVTGLQIQVNDIVVFGMTESELRTGRPCWKTARVIEVEVGRDGHVRTVVLEYKNATENVFRKTRRSVRKLAKLFNEDDVCITSQLNQAAKQSNIYFFKKLLN